MEEMRESQKFIDTYINGDKNVKAYGSYAEVFADKACLYACLPFHSKFLMILVLRTSTRCT